MKKVVFSNIDIKEDTDYRGCTFTHEDIGVILSGIIELEGLNIEVSDLGNGECQIVIGESTYKFWDSAK